MFQKYPNLSNSISTLLRTLALPKEALFIRLIGPLDPESFNLILESTTLWLDWVSRNPHSLASRLPFFKLDAADIVTIFLECFWTEVCNRGVERMFLFPPYSGHCTKHYLPRGKHWWARLAYCTNLYRTQKGWKSYWQWAGLNPVDSWTVCTRSHFSC